MYLLYFAVINGDILQVEKSAPKNKENKFFVTDIKLVSFFLIILHCASIWPCVQDKVLKKNRHRAK